MQSLMLSKHCISTGYCSVLSDQASGLLSEGHLIGSAAVGLVTPAGGIELRHVLIQKCVGLPLLWIRGLHWDVLCVVHQQRSLRNTLLPQAKQQM